MLTPRPRFVRFAGRVAMCSALLCVGRLSTANPSDTDLSPQAVTVPAEPEAIARVFSEKGPAADASGLVAQVREKAADMVMTAMNFLGVRYRRGGNSADAGFDCSGFTRQVFESSLGFMLPRRVNEQAKAAGLMPVKKDELQPGDLVFFNTLRRTFSHVGIYIGEGKFVHSPKPGGEVRVEDMRLVYWAKRFTGGRRAEPMIDRAFAEAQPTAPATTQTVVPTRSLR